MEVSHIDHLDTHAIIGGGNVHKFDTKQDAEFFEILSSTLYSDKKRAFLREVLSNAWDANIEVNKTNVPVRVELTDTHVSISDSGPGISDENMVEVYCTYGGSTKRKKKKQTGGFGLGSKAPFAYAKNFTVTSCHEGVQSIYNISRGTTATEGVPDLRRMVSVPTTKSGLTVSIPIQKGDRSFLLNLIKQLCFSGGIPVRINDRSHKTINYETLPEGMDFIFITKQATPDWFPQQRETQFFVKAGSVVYPIPYEHVPQNIAFMNKPLFQNSDQNVILIAKPDTIGITPSRESLSMTELTIQSLKDLFDNMIKFINDQKETVMDLLYTDYSLNNVAIAFEDQMKIRQLDVMFNCYRNPVDGYLLYAQYMSGSKQAFWYPKMCTDLSDLHDFMLYTMRYHRLGLTEVAHKMLMADPKGLEIKKAIEACISKKFPKEKKRFMNQLRIGTSGKNIMLVQRYKQVNSLYRYLKSLSKLEGVDLTTTVRNNEREPSSFRAWTELYGDTTKKPSIRLGYSIQNFLTYVSVTLGNKLSDIVVVLTQSEAAYQRVVKSEEFRIDRGNPHIILTVRNKKLYQEHKETLKKLNQASIYYAGDPEYKPVPVVKIPDLHVYNMEANVHRVVPYVAQVCTHFIFAPRTFAGKDYKTVNKKIQLTNEHLTTVSYLFPNLLVVSTVQEALYLERQGYINVFKQIADDVNEYFSQEKNMDVMLENISRLSEYNLSYRVGKILSIMSVPSIMEAIGRTPCHLKRVVGLPSVIELFFDLLKGRLAPKYGIQHINKAAQATGNLLQKHFTKDLGAVFNDPIMAEFVNSIPEVSTITEQSRVTFNAALLAAIQSTILHRKLRDMKNG